MATLNWVNDVPWAGGCSIMKLYILVLTLFALAVGRIDAQEDDVTYELVADLAYVDGVDSDPLRHRLDLYTPLNVERYPIVVFVHGGAWVSGGKDSYANIGAALSAYGWGVIIPNYRLSPGVTHPAHVEDVARAYAWIVENIARYGGDPTRIILSGHSAGGHIVSLLALDEQYLAEVAQSPAELLGVIAFSGVFWIDDWIAAYATGAFPDDAQARRDASPIDHVGEDSPPFLILAADDDYPELRVEMDAMIAALEAVDVPVESAAISDRSHFGLVTRLGEPDDPTVEIVAEWIGDRLTSSAEATETP
jgi:acetyl esterase/lipase